MKIEQISTETLTAYARNSRTHSAEQVKQIAASITEFGFCNPVLIDAGGEIIAGHGRVLAAKQLGIADVPCIRLGHLTETQKRAYVIADNQIALNAGWDAQMLALEVEDLRLESFDLELLGFEDLSQFLPVDDIQESKTREIDVDDYDLDSKCPRCGFEFNADK